MKCVIPIFFCLVFSSCESTLCTKGDTKQGLFFHVILGNKIIPDQVDIGGGPTHHRGDPWVSKILVNDNQEFLLITSQKTVHCDNFKELNSGLHTRCKGHKIITKHKVRRHTQKNGYEEWQIIPKEEWENAKTLHHVFSRPPTYHYTNCRYRFFGKFYQFLQFIERA